MSEIGHFLFYLFIIYFLKEVSFGLLLTKAQFISYADLVLKKHFLFFINVEISWSALNMIDFFFQDSLMNRNL